jgi:endonuclease YncB( thermonuclease family)
MKSIYLCTLLLLFSALAQATPPPVGARVVDVYDGDTVTLSTGDKVRLRWVNTPELKPPEAYGVEAREAARALVLNQPVELITGASARDGYGRLLAGVRTEDKDLSMHLTELGLAHVFIIPPDDTDLRPLLDAQARAQKARRGIWSNPRYQGDLHITSFHANATGDDKANINGEYLRLCNISTETIDIQGYRITDLHGNAWEFPPLLIPAGHTVKVHSGTGLNQVDSAAQLSIYLGSVTPIWNNRRDQATIYDRFGEVVDSRLHEVQ